MTDNIVTRAKEWATRSLVIMDGSLKLLILSGVMLFGSYLSGSIPLFIAFSEEKLQVSCYSCYQSETNCDDIVIVAS